MNCSRPEILLIRNPAADLSYRRFAFSDLLTTDGSLYFTSISVLLREAARAELERRNYGYDERNPDIHVGFSLQATGYRQGTLSVEVTAARMNVLVWRGKAEGRITRKWINDPGEEVDRIVRDLFVAFPLSARDGQSHPALRAMRSASSLLRAPSFDSALER